MILNFGFGIRVITLTARYWQELGFAHPNARVDYNLSFATKTRGVDRIRLLNPRLRAHDSSVT